MSTTTTNNELGDFDYISNLNDSIISHILSRLPTEDAVRTSILSKDWKFKWHCIYSVSISDAGPAMDKLSEADWKNYALPGIYRPGIYRRMNGKAANLLKAMESIPLSDNMRSVTLIHWVSIDTTRLNAWIASVMNPNIETFRLLYPWRDSVLPQNLFKCTSLRNLELMVTCIWRVPAIIDGFSNLIDLYLHSVVISNEDCSSDILKFQFEVLKTCTIYKCRLLNTKSVEIHAPTLTTFKWSHPAADDEHLIKILGAQLACFEILDSLNFVLTGSTIAYADIDCYIYSLHRRDLEIRRLFEEISTVKHLVLSSCIMDGIVVEQPNPFPSFHRLERLGISFSKNFKGLMQLLHVTSILRFLELDRCPFYTTDILSYDELNTVPLCVTLLLEEVKVKLSNYSVQVELVNFFLKNAIRLKKLTLEIGSNIPKEFVEQVTTLPRASASVDIVFINTHSR